MVLLGDDGHFSKWGLMFLKGPQSFFLLLSGCPDVVSVLVGLSLTASWQIMTLRLIINYESLVLE